MPDARMIDLGWAMARIEVEQEASGSRIPNLVICWPESETEAAVKPAGSIIIWSEAGLQQLADTLAVWLDEFRIEQQAALEAAQKDIPQ